MRRRAKSVSPRRRGLARRLLGEPHALTLLALPPVLVLAPTATRGEVLCATHSGSVRVRSACRDHERQLDPSAPIPAVLLEDGGATVRFTGVNVQIVSGSGATAGPINGRGKLIVGYNENTQNYPHTGSNNLVVGNQHWYTSFGGLIAGRTNRLTGGFASVTGGSANAADGLYSSVCGGDGNVAGGSAASVSGGFSNAAVGDAASVSGGNGNVATGNHASISGGECNLAGPVGPGVFVDCTGSEAPSSQSVAGGFQNVASGDQATVGGGSQRTATDARASDARARRPRESPRAAQAPRSSASRR